METINKEKRKKIWQIIWTAVSAIIGLLTGLSV